MNAGRSSHDKSVCLSVKHVICDKMNETSAHILIPRKRSFILALWPEE